MGKPWGIVTVRCILFPGFLSEIYPVPLVHRCQVVVFERFWNESVFQFDLVVPNSFFWKSICFLFVENIQEFVIFVWYLFFQQNVFLLLIMSLMKELRSSCFRIYPNIRFIFHFFNRSNDKVFFIN